jgi:hypothetical protein
LVCSIAGYYALVGRLLLDDRYLVAAMQVISLPALAPSPLTLFAVMRWKWTSRGLCAYYSVRTITLLIERK